MPLNFKTTDATWSRPSPLALGLQVNKTQQSEAVRPESLTAQNIHFHFHTYEASPAGPVIFHGAFLCPFDFDKVRDAVPDGAPAPVSTLLPTRDSIMGSR